MAERRDSARISPTAHYTGQVWVRSGLADPALGTRLGALLHAAAAPLVRPVERLFPGLSLDGYLVDRHLAIDAVLTRAIESGRIDQVLEVGAGLSPRGLRFVAAHGDRLRYLDADLPAMARTKRARLRAAGLGRSGPEVIEVDVLRRGGPGSLEAVVETGLDPARGTAIVAEGLLSYFDERVLAGLLERCAGLLERFPAGLLVASLELGGEAGRIVPARALVLFLRVFTSGSVRLHYASADDARAAVERAGFGQVAFHRTTDLLEGARGPQVVRILEAWSRPA